MKKRTSFIRLIKLWGVIFLAGIGACIIAIDLIASYRDFDLRADQMREDYIDRQKQIIKHEVNRVVDFISFEKAQGDALTKKTIKMRVYEAYAIAKNIYQQNKNQKSKAEIQQMILDVLRPIRFDNGRGYYFAVRLDGVEILFADKPEMEGLNLRDWQDARGKYVIRELIEMAEKSGEGFYEYHWTKPDAKGNDFKKISFIKRFEPYDWLIGSGLYVDDVQAQINEKLLSAISRIRFGKEGYIFVNRLNGDALVSNGELFSGEKKLWQVFDKDPEKMKDIFNKELNAALKPDGDYIYYSHIKLTAPNTESPKASFVCGIPNLQWLVGAGVYLDDVEADIAAMREKMNNQIKTKALYFVLMVVAITGIFFLFFNWLSRRLESDFKIFTFFLNRAAHSDEKIDRAAINFIELDRIAESTNEMLTERKQTAEELRQSNEKFRILVEESPFGIALISDDGSYKYINPKFVQIFGYDRDEIPTGKDWFKKAFPDEKYRYQVTSAWKLDRIEYEVGEARPRTFSVTCKNGSKKIINFIPVAMITGDQIMICEDITEAKNLEAQLHQAMKMESIGNLAGGIAHDFNNILSSILGYTELALDDIQEGTLLAENLQEVCTAGKRAKDLVKQILVFARQSDEEIKPIQVDTIAKEVLKFVRSSIPTTIEIRQSIESDSLIMGNPTQIYQVIMNLCTNAAYSMEDGGGILEVGLKDVSTDNNRAIPGVELQPGNYIELKVSDTGSGIDPDSIGLIFEPYFTTKEIGKGTGLGLAMVHGIVESYGGKITVTSDLGKGTAFRVYLPLTKKRGEYFQNESEPLPRGTERVLMVDDEPSVAKMSSQILGRLGYSVTTCTSSNDALGLFRSKPNAFDLVITDMTMPNMTGDKLTVELMKLRPGIPIILCTGYSKKISDKTAAAIGIRAFIYKPIVKAEFAKTVRNVLDAATDGSDVR